MLRMNQIRKQIGLAVLLLASATSAKAGNCDFFDLTSGQIESGRCEVTWTETGATFQLNGVSVEWVDTGRQGQWSTGLLNGQPAARYEIDRTRYSYATLDLTLFLDTTE